MILKFLLFVFPRAPLISFSPRLVEPGPADDAQFAPHARVLPLCLLPLASFVSFDSEADCTSIASFASVDDVARVVSVTSFVPVASFV